MQLSIPFSRGSEHEIWLRAYLRALLDANPQEAQEIAEHALSLYQTRWNDQIVDDRERLNESEWLINLRIMQESENLDQSLHDQGFFDEEFDEAVGGGVASAISDVDSDVRSGSPAG